MTVLNFRAYLLYRRGRVEDAIAAYRRLSDLDPRTLSHLSNLGSICFKTQRYAEAQGAFERQLELQPGDPKTLRNLGFCLERQQSLEKALDCFTRAGDEESAEKVRRRLGPSGRAAVASEADRAPAAVGGARIPARGGETAPPAAALESDVADWLERQCLPQPGEGPELVRAGAGVLVAQVRDKVFVNTAFWVGHRGIVVFPGRGPVRGPGGRARETGLLTSHLRSL